MFNVSQANAIYGINNSQNMMQGLLEQLQTGKRINKAADDASGMAIANQLRSQHQGLSQAVRNSNDAISLTNIADGALQEYTDILMEIRDKTSQAVSDSNSDESRAALQADIDALVESADAIASNTSFNGINLLDGTFTGKQFQTGAYSGQTTSISIDGVASTDLGIDALDVTDTTTSATSMDVIDQALKDLDTIRSGIGSVTNGLESRVRNMENTITNIKDAESTIRDVDEAQARADLDQWNVRNQAATFAFSMAAQTQQNILRLFQ
jgi:flagellin